jgi:hypothetical protein
MGGYRWGGVGTSTTTPTDSVVGTLLTEKNIKKVTKATEKLFKDFPPGSAPKK